MVLTAAADSFAAIGYEATSMRSIADRLGVSKAVLYDCFPGGKRELLEMLLDRTEQRVRQEVVGPLTGDAPVAAALRRLLALLADEPFAARILLGRIGSRDPTIVRRSQRARRRIILTVASFVPDEEAATAPAYLLLLAAAADDTGKARDPEARIDLAQAVGSLIVCYAELFGGGSVGRTPGRRTGPPTTPGVRPSRGRGKV